LRGLTPRAERGKKSQKVSDSHRNDVSPLTQGLRYRAACDIAAQLKSMHRNNRNRTRSILVFSCITDL